MSWLLPPLPPHFDAALRDVHARGLDARIAAAHRLATPDPDDEAQAKKAREALGALSQDRDARVRAAAIAGLAEIGRADDHATVLARLEDDAALVRELAVLALAAIDHPDRQPTLADAQVSAHPEVRFQALSCWVNAYPEQGGDAAMRMTRDDDARVRQLAAQCLGAHPDGSDAVEQRLTGLLRDDDRGVRFEAACALGARGDEAAARILLRHLDEPSHAVRAADALAMHDRPPVRAALGQLAASFLRPAVQRVAASRALVLLGDRAAGTEGLRRVLRAWRAQGRAEALEAVAELGLASLANELRRLARRGPNHTRQAAASALEALAAMEPAG